MSINFELVEASRIIATHHGPGPTCVRMPYVQTKPGKDGNGASSPFLIYSVYSVYPVADCFAEDGKTVEFPVDYMEDRMFAKNYKIRGFDAKKELLCNEPGVVYMIYDC